MANESVVSLVEPEGKSEVESKVESEVKLEASSAANNNGYELLHSKSPVFYDLYERKSELQQQVLTRMTVAV